MRNAIAHAFTPWEWRSRAAVIALVALSLVVLVVGVLATTSPFNAFVAALILGLACVRPAFRSLRRWDAAHRR